MTNPTPNPNRDREPLPPGCWVCLGKPENCNCPRHNEHLQGNPPKSKK